MYSCRAKTAASLTRALKSAPLGGRGGGGGGGGGRGGTTKEYSSIGLRFNNTHVATVSLAPSTTHPQTQVELARSPIRGQEQEQPDISPVPS